MNGLSPEWIKRGRLSRLDPGRAVINRNRGLLASTHKGAIQMIPMLLSFVIAVGLVAEPPQNPSSTSDRDASLKSVKPGETVITIRGICHDSHARDRNSPDCKTVITREQFERLIAAIGATGQTIPMNGRQQFAQAYAELLAYAEAARSSGTETSPEFRDLMDLIRVRTLADIHRRKLQASVSTPSPQEIDEYYRRNPADFTNIKLRRILIPRKNPSAQNQEEYEKRALEIVTDLRERAAKGGDFDQLQKEGFASLGLTSAPATLLGNRRKANLLPEERNELLALSEGGVSKLETETFSFLIYKVEEKSLLAEDEVKDEISREISRQRLENLFKEITEGVQPEFNQEYFSSPGIPTRQQPGGR